MNQVPVFTMRHAELLHRLTTDHDFTAQLSQDDLPRLRAQAYARMGLVTYLEGWPLHLALCLLFLGAGGSIVTLMDQPALSALVLVAGLLLSYAGMVGYTCLLAYPAKQLAQAVQPLKDDPNGCQRALELAQASPRCGQYREQVLGQHREFIHADLGALTRLHQQDENARSAAQREQYYAALHGVSTATHQNF